MRGVGRLRRSLARITPRAIILLYHRVAQISSDPQLLSVTPQHFSEHLAVLRSSYRPLTLRDLTRRSAPDVWWPRGVVVTFDDGYADNAQWAKPLLEKRDVPATVFVVAGQVGRPREFWWDDLARLLLTTPTPPHRLELTIRGEKRSWNLVDVSGQPVALDVTAWHVLMDDDANPRHVAYRELAALLRLLPVEEREASLVELAEWAGVQAQGRPENRPLNEVELRALAGEGSLVEVGAHTMTHPVLSSLSPSAQQSEIADSKQRLEDIVGQQIVSFSYPFGGRDDYTAETVKFVRDAGFACSCSNFPGVVNRGSDRYQLPRFLVRDWDGDEFARRLRGWLAA